MQAGADLATISLSDVQLAAVGSLFLWSYAACSPFAGYLGDRVSRSRTIALMVCAQVSCCTF